MPKRNLQKREKMAVAAVAGLAIVLLFQFVARPPLERYRAMKRTAAVARANLSTAQMQRDQIVTERQNAEALRRYIGGQARGNLEGLVSRQLTQAELLQNPRNTWSTDPRYSSDGQFKAVSIRLEDVTLEQIVNLLHGFYSSGNVLVMQSINIEPSPNGVGLRCQMVLLSPQV